MATPETGMLFMPRAQYDALPDRVNFSTLKHIAKNPAAYLHALLHRDEGDTDARLRGRAVHTRVYEPEVFKATYVVWEDRRAGKDWQDFKKKHEADGKEILTIKGHADVLEIANAIRANAMAAPFLTGGKREQTVLWSINRPAMGGLDGYAMQLKSRLDFVRTDCIVDLKTCRSAEPSKFARQAAELFYYAQAAFYIDALSAATNSPKRPYVIIAAEVAPPYVTQVFRLPEVLIEHGRQTYLAWLDRLNTCRTNNDWPGYAYEPVDLVLPSWAMPQDEVENDPTGLGLIMNSSTTMETANG